MTLALPDPRRPRPARRSRQVQAQRRARQLSALQVLPDAVRSMGLAVFATKGVGKSRLLGRICGWQDLARGTPLVILDPLGGTIDNLLAKIASRPAAEQEQLWPRVRYVNGRGQDGRIVPFPVYARAYDGEPLSDVAQRFPDVLAQADPALAEAPVLGHNALGPLATSMGIVLAGLGLGITEAASLLEEPWRWEARLGELARSCPQAGPAVEDLRKLAGLSPQARELRTLALQSKLSLFRHAGYLRATFGASVSGIDWDEVVAAKQAVLLDFRDVTNFPEKTFLLLWVFRSLLSFIKRRGHNMQHPPLSFMIDEVSYLVSGSGVSAELFAADLDELVNRLARSHRIFLTVAGQEPFQLPERLQKTVLSMGNVLLGRMSDEPAAQQLARRYFRCDLHKVKKTEPVTGVIEPAVKYNMPGMSTPPIHGITHYRTTEYTIEEQVYQNSRILLTLPRFTFLLGTCRCEGELATELSPVTIAGIDANQYPDEALTTFLRSQLMRRDGQVVEDVLAEIARRQPTAGSQQPIPGGTSRRSPPVGTGRGPGPAGSGEPDQPVRTPRRSEGSSTPAGAGSQSDGAGTGRPVRPRPTRS